MMVGDFFNFKFKTRIFWHCKWAAFCKSLPLALIGQ
jgi:hypothetical protein